MLTRLATRAALAGKRTTTTTARYNSSSTSSTAARVIQIAARTERPSATEAAIPALWAACGALTYTAWNRLSEESAGGNVERLIIV
ncbi:hypothetical protein IAQ61_007478 [Plenodomus lingam]|uniref:uncharacterized protein n=1 Tax=Leptosphaeria maculans TaxID=5022 RepID=UPI003323BE49|nr:hypothetical protein IAQ61_007478 [Plenodomus lingam]